MRLCVLRSCGEAFFLGRVTGRTNKDVPRTATLKGRCWNGRGALGATRKIASQRASLGRREALPQAAEVALAVLGSIASFVGMVSAVPLALLFTFQRKLLFLPESATADPQSQGGEAQVVLLPADGATGVKRYAAAFFRPPLETAPVLVYFHGNADQLGYGPAFLGSLFQEEYALGLYGVEYPGYGLAQSSGPPTEASMYAAAEAALRHLEEGFGVDRSRIVLFGQSIGCGVAVEMAKRGYGAKLILLAPFTNVPDIAMDLFPFLGPLLRLAPWFVLDRFDNAAKAPSVEQPALVVHGTIDEVVPAWMGEKVAELLPRSKLLLAPNMGHNDVFDREDVLDAIAKYARVPAAKL